MKGWRKINIRNEEWKYKIGKFNVVAKKEKETIVINLSELTCISWDEIERGVWKGYFSITPKHIANWLNK